MARVTFAGSTFNTTAGDKNVVITPADQDLIVVVAATSGLAGGTTAVADNDGGTYDQVDVDRTGFSTTGVLTMWVRTALITTPGSTTFTASQAGSSGGGLHVYRVAGMHLVGAAAVRSSGGQSSGTAGTTPAPVLSQLPNPRNPIMLAVAAGANAAVLVPRTGYSEGADGGYNTPATGLGSSFLDSGESTDTLTCGGTTSTTFASIAIELNTLERPTPAINFQNPALLMEALRDSWERTRGILVPKLWTPRKPEFSI